MFKRRGVTTPQIDNHGVATVVWDREQPDTPRVPLFHALTPSARSIRKEMKALRASLNEKLRSIRPQFQSYYVNDKDGHAIALRHTSLAFGEKDIELLRVIDQYFGRYPVSHIVICARAIRRIGYSPELLDEQYIDIARRIRHAYEDVSLNFYRASFNAMEETDQYAALPEEAISIAYSDPSATDRIIYLITKRGITDANELRQALEDTDGIGTALMDGSL